MRVIRAPLTDGNPSMRWCGALACGAALLAACGSKDEGRPHEDLGSLVHSQKSEPEPIDVDEAATDADELARALALPHSRVGELIDAHRVAGESSVEVVEDGETVEALTDRAMIFVDSHENFHATLENSKDYGRHVFFVDGQLYLRPRYGAYHRRPPTREDEPGEIRGEIFAAAGAYFDLLVAGAEVTDGGTRQVAGRTGRVIEIARAPTMRERKPDPREQRAWRNNAHVEDVGGQVVLDAETGVPLAAEIRGKVSFVRAGRSFVMSVGAEHQISDIGTADEVTPPTGDVLDLVESSSEVAERRELLEDIAPPARKAPTPAGGGAPDRRTP